MLHGLQETHYYRRICFQDIARLSILHNVHNALIGRLGPERAIPDSVDRDEGKRLGRGGIRTTPEDKERIQGVWDNIETP